MIPARVTMKAALVCERRYHESLRFFGRAPYGFDFAPAGAWAFEEISDHRFAPGELLSPAATVAELEMATIAGLPAHVEGEIVPEGAAEVYGIAGWFEADLGHGVRLDTGPSAPETHWQPLFFPFAGPLRVEPSRAVRVRLSPVQFDVIHTRWQWWAGDGQSERSGDNMMWPAYLGRPLPAGMLK